MKGEEVGEVEMGNGPILIKHGVGLARDIEAAAVCLESFSRGETRR